MSVFLVVPVSIVACVFFILCGEGATKLTELYEEHLTQQPDLITTGFAE